MTIKKPPFEFPQRAVFYTRLKHSPQPFRPPPSKGAKPLKSKAVAFYWFSPFEGGAAIAAGGCALNTNYKITAKHP
jgi:hypothetical protein